MNEMLTMFFIFVAGLILIRVFLGPRFPLFNTASAFPMGIVLWVFCYILIYFLRFVFSSALPGDSQLTFMLFCCVVGILFILNMYRFSFTWCECMIYTLAMAMFIGIYHILDHIPLSIITRDSLSWLDPTAGFGESLRRGFPIFNQCVQALSLLIHYDRLLIKISPVTGMSLALMMSYLVFHELRDTRSSSSFIAVSFHICLALSPVLLLFSPFMGIYMFFYFNHHIIAATLIFLFAASCWFTVRNGLFMAIYPGTLALMAFTLSRMEGLLCAIVMFPIFLSSSEIPPKHQRIASGLFLLGMIPWHGYVVWMLRSGSLQASTQQHFLIVLFAICALGIFQLNRWRMGWLLLKYVPYSIPIVALFTLVILALLKPQVILISTLYYLLLLLFDNQQGGWGYLWVFIVIAAVIVTLFRFKKPSFRFMDAFLLSWGALMLVMLDVLFFVGGTGVYLTASLNRIIFHFLPLILVWIVTQFGSMPSQEDITEYAT